eukprot:Gb_00835 [translate_table: standard]
MGLLKNSVARSLISWREVNARCEVHYLFRDFLRPLIFSPGINPLRVFALLGSSNDTTTLSIILGSRYKEKRWDAKRLLGSGGMPSSHSATVTALAVAIGLHDGPEGSSFAIALVLACVVCISLFTCTLPPPPKKKERI